MSRWTPLGAVDHFVQPPVGRKIALGQAVWKVLAVGPADLDPEDRQVWVDAGMPDLETWLRRPYEMVVKFDGGRRPKWLGDNGEAECTVRARDDWPVWWVYPASGRWPQCSCCGEPMPCRADLQDKAIDATMASVEKMVRRQPGSCWSCGEMIRPRQKTIAYPGDNVDLPGGIDVVFHTRRDCWFDARSYELRWLAADPRRERILTYPDCPGILAVHGDGSSTCLSSRHWFRGRVESAPDCRGHLTHDHQTLLACYTGGLWSDPDDLPTLCPKGCTSIGHPGTQTSPRPPRR